MVLGCDGHWNAGQCYLEDSGDGFPVGAVYWPKEQERLGTGGEILNIT